MLVSRRMMKIGLVAVLPVLYAGSASWADPPAASPEIVSLDDLEDIYEPVPFDHRGHADMAEMSSGCVTCHHHTPAGEDHPACRSCHPLTKTVEGSAMPGLRGAYHRQCMSCHREWSHDTACNACHVSKPQRGRPAGLRLQRSVDQVTRRMAPPVECQETYVYETRQAPQPVVTFHHGDHAESFGLRCVQCHRGDSCGSCHDRAPPQARVAPHAEPAALKSRCTSCHEESNCAFCHDQGQRPAFDHAKSAGWVLGTHHAKVPCSGCHGPADQFKIPSKSCHGCHAQAGVMGTQRVASAAQSAGGAEDFACLTCHSEMSARFEHAASVHGPAAAPTGCRTCHDQSAGHGIRPSRQRQPQLCLQCHDRQIDTDRGRPLANMAALLADKPNHHGPVRDGECSACHDPHASTHARLLVGEYASEFYAPFALNQYELCFRCHSEQQVLSESGAELTGFRDGDLNLHWLHVNREKGRTCRVCHEVHASCRPFHIRESVPFGDSAWVLPINFEQHTSGGTCSPGCHGAKSYDREQSTKATVISRPRPTPLS